MTSQKHESLERLQSYEILPSLPAGGDAFMLTLRTKSSEFRGIADRQSLLKLAAAIKKEVSAAPSSR
jgi:hypothetical protein